MAADRETEGDAGFGPLFWVALTILLVQVVVWLAFGFSAMFWPALILSPVVFWFLVRICTGRI